MQVMIDAEAAQTPSDRFLKWLKNFTIMIQESAERNPDSPNWRVLLQELQALQHAFTHMLLSDQITAVSHFEVGSSIKYDVDKSKKEELQVNSYRDRDHHSTILCSVPHRSLQTNVEPHRGGRNRAFGSPRAKESNSSQCSRPLGPCGQIVQQRQLCSDLTRAPPWSVRDLS